MLRYSVVLIKSTFRPVHTSLLYLKSNRAGAPSTEGQPGFPKGHRVCGFLPRPEQSGIFSTGKGTLIRSVNTIESIQGNLGYRTSLVRSLARACACILHVPRPKYRELPPRPREKSSTSGSRRRKTFRRVIDIFSKANSREGRGARGG